jgi:hypothetical protein
MSPDHDGPNSRAVQQIAAIDSEVLGDWNNLKGTNYHLGHLDKPR